MESYSKNELKGFANAVQSLKLYRRAELRDANDDEPLIEKLYVDPLQNDGVLETMLRSNTTFLIGRKGTGKSTVFQRAQYAIRNQKGSVSAYIDLKTVFESASVDPELGAKLSVSEGSLSEAEIKRLLLFRSFTKAVFEDVQKELRSQLDSSLINRFLGRTEQVNAKRLEAIEAIDQLLDGIFEDDAADISALTKSTVDTGSETRATKEIGVNAGTSIKVGMTGTSADLNANGKWSNSSGSTSTENHKFSQILLRTFSINSVMARLESVLHAIGVRHLVIFIDDFSEIPQDAMIVFVDTVLAPLNNWSNELIKFKVAAYPGRVYLGKIDPTKIDEIYLDTYRLYGLNDVSSMEEKAIDFTTRLLKSRFDYYPKTDFERFCESDSQSIYRQLFYASMGNPRILGHILHNLRESHIGYGRRIGSRAIQDAAARYYEEKIEPFFGMHKFSHESFEERSSIFSLKELLESFVERARELRDYKDSSVTRDISGRTPSSHFYVLNELEQLLTTLELNFFVTKYFEMKDRDGRKVSVYALNYGLCSRYTITFGRPVGKREHRLYFVERIFDYSNIIRKYVSSNQEIKCDNCGETHGLDRLESLMLFDMMCPSCKKGTCSVSNLSKKYEQIITQVDKNLLLPSTEIGIMEALYTEKAGLAAADIAGELDCSYQLVGKRGKIMADRGLVHRGRNERGRRIFTITERAKGDYFVSNEDRKLDIGD